MKIKSHEIDKGWRLSGRHSFCIRTLNLRSAGFLAVALFTLVCTGSALAQPVAKPVAPGVTLTQEINTDPAAAMVLNYLTVDPKAPGVRVAVALAQDTVIEPDITKGRERVSATVKRKGAIAGVNADYFPYTGDPLGLAITGGELVSEPMDRAALGVTSSGQIMIDRMSYSGTITSASGASYKLGGLNRQRGKNEAVLFSPVYGAATGSTEGVEVPLTLSGPVKPNMDVTATVAADPAATSNSPIPKDQAILSAGGPAGQWVMQNLHKGDSIKIRCNITAASGKSWDGVVEAVGGGPILIKDGQIAIDGEEEAFSSSLRLLKHPRTAVGVTSDGKLLLVTVDGRQDFSQGMNLSQLAWLMKRLGAVSAMNLDGGGSTSFSVMGAVINSPSEGLERPVADALVVYANQPSGSEVKFCQTGPLVVSAGATQTMSLAGIAPTDPSVVWGTTGGIGFINQKGYFIPLKARKGSVVAIVNGTKAELPITVIAGKPAVIEAKIGPDPSGATNRGQVTVTVDDAYGNGNFGVSVTLSIKGALADSTTAITDDKGTATFGVMWDSTPDKAVVTVSAAGLATKAK